MNKQISIKQFMQAVQKLTYSAHITLSGTRAESQVELDSLLPSVLDRAFKGEL